MQLAVVGGTPYPSHARQASTSSRADFAALAGCTNTPAALLPSHPPQAVRLLKALSSFSRSLVYADERALRVPRRSHGLDHRGARIEAPAESLLFGVRVSRAVHMHALRVSVLQLQMLRAAQGDALPQVRVLDTRVAAAACCVGAG